MCIYEAEVTLAPLKFLVVKDFKNMQLLLISCFIKCKQKQANYAKFIFSSLVAVNNEPLQLKMSNLVWRYVKNVSTNLKKPDTVPAKSTDTI